VIEILVHDPESLADAVTTLDTLFLDGQKFTIQFVPDDYEPYTTLQLNKAHAMFGDIAKASRHTVKEVKAAMMSKFFPATFFDFFGERCEFRKSFTDLTKAEASHLIDSMEPWAADNGIYIK
jgi:hypothetical protein